MRSVRADSSRSSLVSEWFWTFEPSTALFLMLARPTAPDFRLTVPTLLAGNRTTAYDVPPIDTASAVNATTIDGEGMSRRPIVLDMTTSLGFGAGRP